MTDFVTVVEGHDPDGDLYRFVHDEDGAWVEVTERVGETDLRTVSAKIAPEDAVLAADLLRNSVHGWEPVRRARRQERWEQTGVTLLAAAALAGVLGWDDWWRGALGWVCVWAVVQVFVSTPRSKR